MFVVCCSASCFVSCDLFVELCVVSFVFIGLVFGVCCLLLVVCRLLMVGC